MELKEVKLKIESLLFASYKPLTIEEISKIINIDKETVKKALNELIEEYKNRAIEIAETPEGYELRIKPEFRNEASKVAIGYDLSKGMLKTLALVIYKNPIKQSEIIKIQGNRAYDYIRKLESKGLIKSKKVGKTKLIYLSENIEKYFGLSLKEIKEKIESIIKQES
ncbi:MAG: SMC-Scp complex subunit ScpB [Candidatus Aenigmatarchaeota archaeon]